MSEEKKVSTRHASVPVWKIWANPIVRRYARSRLRLSGFGISLLVMLLIAGFIFLTLRAGFGRAMHDVVDYARVPIFPLLGLQGLILFVLGSGQVAGGMTTEADEGTLDYQRLAPMSPLSKVLGYLFGLPIREWAIFWATMPLSIISMWQGEVPLKYGLQLYAVFIVAAVLYHLTGLLAGTVVKNRRLALLGSMALVFVLYTIIPQAAKFGLVYFKYLTIYPVVEEVLPHMTSRPARTVVDAFQRLAPQAKFFALDLPQYLVTLVSQATLCFALIVMLWRRWKKADAHLLGKLGAVGLFGWIQLVLLGNALPLIDGGDVFPSRELGRQFGQLLNPATEFWRPRVEEAFLMIGLYGLVTLIFLWWMTFLITPDTDTQVRGWRRARKFGKSKLPLLSDPATSYPWVLAMAGIGIFGWFTFASAILGSKWFAEFELARFTLLAMALVLVCGSLGMQTLLEWKGKKFVALMAVLVGLLPAMIAFTMGASSDRLIGPAVWVMGLCPLSWPIYGSGVSVPGNGLSETIGAALPGAFWFWQLVALVAVTLLSLKLRESRKKISIESVD